MFYFVIKIIFYISVDCGIMNQFERRTVLTLRPLWVWLLGPIIVWAIINIHNSESFSLNFLFVFLFSSDNRIPFQYLTAPLTELETKTMDQFNPIHFLWWIDYKLQSLIQHLCLYIMCIFIWAVCKILVKIKKMIHSHSCQGL